MRCRMVLTPLTTLMLASMPASGQQVLTLEQAVSASLARHPAMVEAEASSGRAEAGAREVHASRLPALSLEANLTQFQEPMVVAPLHGFDPRTPPVFDRLLAQGALTAAYSVFDGGERSARLRRSEAVLEGAASQWEQSRQALIGEVVRRYAAVLTARRLAQAHERRVAALDQERARATRLLEEGRVARVVLLRAEATLSGARAELQSAESAVRLGEAELARIMVVDPALLSGAVLEDISVRGEPPARGVAVESGLTTNLEVRRLRSQVRAAGTSVDVAGSQWWPRLHLGGRYVRYGSGQGDAGGEWQAGAQLSYQLFTGGARPAGMDRARWEVRAAEAELAQAELRVAEVVERAVETVAATRARTAAWQAAVAQMEEVARIERLALDTGAGLQTDYLAAEAELLRARAALAESRHAELLARVELVWSMGQLTTGWIMENVERGT
jgi:outer membrane protein TolC